MNKLSGYAVLLTLCAAQKLANQAIIAFKQNNIAKGRHYLARALKFAILHVCLKRKLVGHK